jgi:hypothetical protein
LIKIEKIIPNSSEIKAVGIKIGEEIFIAIPQGTEIETEFIKKIEGDLNNG